MPGGRRAVGLSSSATHDSLLLHVFPSLCPRFPDWTSLFFKEILKYFFRSLFETTLLFQFSFLCFNFSELARRASSGSHKINVQNRENKSKPIINYRYYLIKNKLPWLLQVNIIDASQEQAEHNPIFPLGGITTQKKVFAIFPFMVKT